MPISGGKFERGKPSDLVDLILDFLRTYENSAYSRDEIEKELASRGLSLTTVEIGRVLSLLEGWERVEAKTIDGINYYKYRKILGSMLIRRRT